MNETRSLSSQIIAGGLIIVVGILLLLDQINLLDFGSIFQFFPLLFIGLAAWQLWQNGRQHATGPLISIAVFGILQLAMLDIINWDIFGKLWPLILIGIGASILLRQRNGKDMAFSTHDRAADARFDVFAMFGGGGRQVSSQAFEGGNATVLFGGAEINLHHMQVEDKPAVINVFAMFGGVVIKASNDTLIANHTFAMFGATSDERKQRKSLAGEKPDVVVKGTVLFGGLSIEN